MLKSRLSRYTILLLLCLHSATFAADQGFYLIARKSAGTSFKEAEPVKQIKQADEPSKPEAIPPSPEDSEEKGEWGIFCDQISGIIEQTKKDKQPSVLSELRKNAWSLFSFPPQYGFCEAGIGYYFKIAIPFSLEIKGLFENTENLESKANEWHLFYAVNLKAFLPLGSRTKLYAKIGKSFILNHTKPSTSMLPTDNEVWDDMKATFLDKTPKAQWELSRTFLGLGIIRKCSSRIELDGSVEGYTLRDLNHFYFTTSLGINYLFQ